MNVGAVDRSGQQKCTICTDSWTLPSVSKEREVIIFAKSDRMDGLRVPQVARSPKVAIVRADNTATMTTTDIQTDCFIASYTLTCACARVKADNGLLSHIT